MPGFLVQSDLLRRGQTVTIGPVSGQVVKADQQVGHPVLVPVNGHKLDDSPVVDPQAGPNSQMLAENEFGYVSRPVVRQEHEPVVVQGDQVKSARSPVRDGARAAQAVQRGDVNPRVKLRGYTWLGGCHWSVHPARTPARASPAGDQQVSSSRPVPVDNAGLGVPAPPQRDGRDR